ncbi:MalY/PatB family protein [Compostimonas suwonensis]|uniref:cysteine-S-conjugate beta-lyase n=1 Tax=Compostimonas suwonensis TaxID=1048394 RepID=A0A2M9BWM1_9MICO|nr:aminotransferase class I/II-fold pyridoxal phosphate-dependent enzyme [Compostimonas suwonensis]PJJ62324.1 cystathionine beta-lyase [Compostimonas suwonensis]
MALIHARPVDTIRRERSSIKWTRFPPDVLPLFVAEMDYALATPIVETLVQRIRASDTGYVDAAGPLAPAFGAFAAERWGWAVDPRHVHVATDVSVGIVETLRLVVPSGGTVVVTPPVYPPFFELVEEAGAVVAGVPLLETASGWALDLEGLERAFAAGAHAFLLCNPHNPHGLVHDARTLAAVARLAARYGVFVVSDEIHAPLTHPGVEFTPFTPLARDAGARSVCVTSASKGWNLAGTKCALLVAGDEFSAQLLDTLPEEVANRTSILGLHANVVAFSCTDWLDDAVEHIVANDRLLDELLRAQLPAVVYHRPHASYLAWLDIRGLGLGESAHERILHEARVALNDGATFGSEGRGFVRLNLACAPETLREAVARIARLVASPAPAGAAVPAPAVVPAGAAAPAAAGIRADAAHSSVAR